jgi:hypothetical protein
VAEPFSEALLAVSMAVTDWLLSKETVSSLMAPRQQNRYNAVALVGGALPPIFDLPKGPQPERLLYDIDQ